MKTRIWTVLLAAVFFLSACGLEHEPPPDTTMDFKAISSRVTKAKARPQMIEGNEAGGGKVAETRMVPPVKDMTGRVDGRNPFLKKLAGPPPAAAAPSPARSAGQGVLLNFDNADIYEVIQVIAEILRLDYIIDPQVKGKVNIRSGRRIPIEQLPAVFRKILHINGLDIRKEGKYSYIFPVKKPAGSAILSPNEAGRLAESPRVVTQVMPVMHMAADEAVKLIKPYLSAQGQVYRLESQNTVIVQDFESKVLDAMVVLSKLDVSPLANLKIRMVRVRNAPLFDLRDELDQILTAMGVNSKGHEGVSTMALERVNSLLLMGEDQELIDTATRWALELDVVPKQGRDNIYIYNVRNAVATELASLVNDLIAKKGGKRRAAAKTAAAKDGKGGGKAARPAARTVSGPAAGGLRFAGEPLLIADDSRNVILIRALPADHRRLVKLLERLDNMPRQVLVEVMVAEVTLSNDWQMGIDWYLHNHDLKIGGSTYEQSYGSSSTSLFDSTVNGFNFKLTNGIVGDSETIYGLLNTVASDNDVAILSSPHIMVLNNEEAEVNVGQEVPIITTQTVSGAGDAPDANNVRTVQYRDTGVVLKVTPRINYNGIILLDIQQQVSDVTANTTSSIDSPVIIKRDLKTKLAVKDGQSILMGGLLSNKNDNGERGIPILKDIPLLGWLFKSREKSQKKTELLVMITPYVIDSEDVLDQYIKQFDAKMQELRQRLRKGGGKKDAPVSD
jgi:general secretion pathway protein D